MVIKKKTKKSSIITAVNFPDTSDGKFAFTMKKDPRLPVGFLSPSAVSMYQDCGHAYYLRYVQGLKMPPSVAMVEGISHHHWLDHNNQHKIGKGKDLTVADALDVFHEDWKERSKETIDGNNGNRGDVSKRARPLIQQYMSTLAPVIDPAYSERQADVIMNGVPMMIKIDVHTKSGITLDYKVSSRKKSTSDVTNSLQLPLYSAVMGAKRAGLVSMVHTKNVVAQETHAFANHELEWAGEIVVSVADAIGRGSFPKAKPDSWKCSERFCGYWHMCRGAKAATKKPNDDLIQKLKGSIADKREQLEDEDV